MATLYSNLPVSIFVTGVEHFCASTSASVSLSPKLEENKNLSLAPNQHFKIGGNLDVKVSLNFFAATSLFSGVNYTATQQILSILTGDVRSDIKIGSTVVPNCYLENLSMEIAPFMPTMMSADFICLSTNFDSDSLGAIKSADPTTLPPGDAIYYQNLLSMYGEDVLVYLNGSSALPENGMYYGHNVVITGGNLLTNTRETLSYKVSCNRSPVYTIGSIDATNCFLDAVSKEISIKSDNVNQFINYSGSADNPNKESLITVSLRTPNQIPLEPPLFFSHNARIISQNLSINAGDVLGGQVTLREIIL
jgi:hypothetical protein